MISRLIHKIKTAFAGHEKPAAQIPDTPASSTSEDKPKRKRPPRKPRQHRDEPRRRPSRPKKQGNKRPQTKDKPQSERPKARPAEPIRADDDWVCEKDTEFTALGLPNALLHAIDDLGYTELSAVQKIAFPITLAGKDIAGQGRTGTGKTATFLITALN